MALDFLPVVGYKNPMESWMSRDVDPLEQFDQWFKTAQIEQNFEPTAMILATVDSRGFPSARVVLLKKHSDQGFMFFTNYQSIKAQELAKDPKASLVFHWAKPFHRQIRVKGLVEKVSVEESDAYFETRARGSQIGAWASPQSHEIRDREELVRRVKEAELRFADGPVSRPEFWGGYLLKPQSIEFWQGEEHRLHNRMSFILTESGWQSRQLAP